MNRCKNCNKIYSNNSNHFCSLVCHKDYKHNIKDLRRDPKSLEEVMDRLKISKNRRDSIIKKFNGYLERESQK